MSKLIFARVSLALIILLCINARQSRKNHGRIGKSMAMLLYSGVISLSSYGLVFLSDDYRVLSLGYSLFFASMDFYCYAIFRYVIDYTRHKGKTTLSVKKGLIYGTYAVIAADAVSMACNAFLGHAAEFRPVFYKGEGYLNVTHLPAYYVHLCICYLLIAESAFLLIRKVLVTPRLYRKKYNTVLFTFLMFTVIDIVWDFIDTAVDPSALFCALALLFVHYATTFYMPDHLEKDMQRLTQDKQRDIIVMYDNEDNCIYKNLKASRFLQGEKGLTKQGFEQIWRYADEERKLIILAEAGKKTYFSKEYKELLDENGRYIGCFFIMHDITKEKALQEKYRYLATHDELTGLYNREYFFEQAEKFIKSRQEEELLMICSDIRQFKVINDILGNEMGNTILKNIAQALILDDDGNRVYGRIAGDSFAMCIPRENFHEIPVFKKVGSSFYIQEINYPIMNHLGIYRVKNTSIPASVMCDRAMLAAASIKDDLQREIAYYDDKLREELIQENELVQDLLSAFEKDQFLVYLQPQFNHHTKAIVGAEALVRWFHPEKGMISPGIFIPLIEQKGLISKLDCFVWREACKILQRYEEQGKKISLSVNISTKDFYYLDLYEEFMSLIREYAIEPSRLKLEITESAVMQDLLHQVTIIEKLQAEGFIIEMDDFGSGYSSLNTLKDIPVDILKLDMKFMEKSGNMKRSATILQAMIEMANKLHMCVIAEGVEMEEQADYLAEIGCNIIQGYYYAKPMSVEEFDRLFEKSSYQEIMEREK